MLTTQLFRETKILVLFIIILVLFVVQKLYAIIENEDLGCDLIFLMLKTIKRHIILKVLEKDDSWRKLALF